MKEVLAAAPRALVCAHTEEAPYLDGRKVPMRLAEMEERIRGGAPETGEDRRRRAEAASNQFPVGRELTGGEVLPICGGIEIYHTPGHMPGHICLISRPDGILITGDALNLAAGGALAGPNPVYTRDMAKAYDSLRQLRGRGVKLVVCYHGGVFRGEFDGALDALLAAE